MSPTLLCMSDETRRPRPAVQYGPTAAAVAENVKRLRDRRGLTIYELSGALERINRPITPSAIAKIEKQQRQVTVDDLAALAVVFGVSPGALLLPLDDDPGLTVDVTGAGTVPADVAWDWMDGKRPLQLPEGDVSTADMEFRLYGRPPFRRRPHGIVLRPRGARGREQMAKIREGYALLESVGLDIDEIQRLDAESFKAQMREGEGGSSLD